MQTIITDKNKLAETSARNIAALITTQIDETGRCVLALSGGNSPKPMLMQLAQQPLKWECVRIALVDERWTDHISDRNETMLMAFINAIPDPKPQFTSLSLLQEFEINLKKCNQQAKTLNVNIIVLGMGLDGHTASLFPDADEYLSALSTKEKYVAINPKQAPYPRISMSLNCIQQAKTILLYIPGTEKYDCLMNIINSPNAISPIKSLVETVEDKLTVYSSKD